MAKSKLKQALDKAQVEVLPKLADVDELAEFQWELGANQTITSMGLVEKWAELKAREKQVEEDIKFYKPLLMAIVEMSGHEKLDVGKGRTLKIGRGSTPATINPTKLLEQGVTVEQIQAATEEGTPYTYPQIVMPKAATNGK